MNIRNKHKIVVDKRGTIILSFGIQYCSEESTKKRGRKSRNRNYKLNFIIFLHITTSSVIRDKEILDLTERSCFQVKITEQIELKKTKLACH